MDIRLSTFCRHTLLDDGSSTFSESESVKNFPRLAALPLAVAVWTAWRFSDGKCIEWEDLICCIKLVVLPLCLIVLVQILQRAEVLSTFLKCFHTSLFEFEHLVFVSFGVFLGQIQYYETNIIMNNYYETNSIL